MQRPGGVADDHDPVGHVPGDHGPGPDEGTAPDGAPLQHDGAGADGRAFGEVDRPADPRPGEHGDQVLEDGVVADGGAVLHVHVRPDADVAADVGQRHDHGAGADDALRSDDGARVDQAPPLQAEPVQLGGEPAADARVGDADDVRGPGDGRGGVGDGQTPDDASRRPLVEEAGNGQPEGQRHVEHLAARAAGADDEEVHGRHPAAPHLGDALLLSLLGLFAGWTYVAGGRVEPQLLLLAGVALAYVVGRLCASSGVLRTLAPLAVAAGVAAAVLLAEDGLSGTALAGPVGYGNANGALCTLGVGAAVVAGLSRRRRLLQLAGLLAGCGLAWLAAQTGSAAAVASSVLLLAAGLVVLLLPRAARWLPALGALGLLVAVAGTVLLGSGVLPASGPAEALSERRVVLWEESLDLAAAEPVTGVGVGGFATTAPTAVADMDARWSHSAWLQAAAETGYAGAGLLLALGLTATAGAGRARCSPAGALAGLTAAAVLVQASIDYVLHFAALPVVLAGLVGVAATGRDVAPRPGTSA